MEKNHNAILSATACGDGGESLSDAERRALGAMGLELSRHTALTERAFNLIGLALSSNPEAFVRDVSQSQKVATMMMSRISNDLRCATLVAVRGYAVQAATIVSSMYEGAYAIAYIAGDNALAEKWISHNDPTRPFEKARTMTISGLSNLRIPNPEKQAAIEYCVYRQLCMAKHSNPFLQTRLGYEIGGGAIVVRNGPDLSEPAVRLAWFALEHAANLAFIALTSFIANHVPKDKQGDLIAQTQALGAERKVLEVMAAERWGTEDPCLGKW